MRNIPHEGLGVCTCRISHLGQQPTPWGFDTLEWKCCAVCGYPSVHRMDPLIRDRAFTRIPTLRNQTILDRSEPWPL